MLSPLRFWQINAVNPDDPANIMMKPETSPIGWSMP